MTFDDAVVAMRAALVAGFSACPLTYENERASGTIPPEPPGPWARIEFRHTVGSQQSIGAPGDNLHEDHAAMLVYLFAPQMGGDQTCRQYLDQIVAVFRGKEIGGGIEVQDILGDDGGGTDESGAWWRRWRRIEFRFWLTG